jgi:aminocarboxymuconate-semialdehyde decarboxylase
MSATPIGRREFLTLGASAGALLALGPRRALFQRPVSIDVHAHWEPEPYFQALAKLRPFTGTRDPRDFDLDTRRAWMDRHGVQMHVLTLDGGMPWQWVAPAEGARLAQIINDAAIEAHTAYPDRFIGVVEMSVRSPDLALGELNRVAGRPGIRAVHLSNSIEGRDYLFEPEYAPLLARCEELGYPLLFHPLDGEANYYGGKDRIGDALSVSARLHNTLGFPFESATTAAKFITTGTLDRYPKLEIVLPHSGGAFPYVAGRVGHGMERNKFALQRPFLEYVRRFHYDSLTYYPGTLRFLIDLVGSDRVVIGSDNFAPMDVEFPNALVEGLRLPAANRERILRGNAARLFRL